MGGAAGGSGSSNSSKVGGSSGWVVGGSSGWVSQQGVWVAEERHTPLLLLLLFCLATHSDTPQTSPPAHPTSLPLARSSHPTMVWL